MLRRTVLPNVFRSHVHVTERHPSGNIACICAVQIGGNCLYSPAETLYLPVLGEPSSFTDVLGF